MGWINGIPILVWGLVVNAGMRTDAVVALSPSFNDGACFLA